jgi:hypothetical protein
MLALNGRVGGGGDLSGEGGARRGAAGVPEARIVEIAGATLSEDGEEGQPSRVISGLAMGSPSGRGMRDAGPPYRP